VNGHVYIESVGLIAPGMIGWAAAAPMLRGETPYAPAELPPYAPELLPPNERRRATPVIRLAFRTAEDAMRGSSRPASELATVFGSSDGDTDVMHRINVALAQPQRALSPTDFHNSVHNAPAGYWSIAVGSKLPSTSLAAHDAVFAASLLEAAALLLGDGVGTLLAVYDVKMPVPLDEKRPIPEPFGSALVLRPEPGERALAKLGLARSVAPVSTMRDPALETLRRANPAACALPLLELLARGAAGVVHLPAQDGSLTLTVEAP
jgi:hypothetical protein